MAELRIALATLPVSDKFKHLRFLRKHKQHIMNALSVDEIFEILDEYWDYTDYYLLQHLIQEFGGSRLKKEMREYVTALEQFEKRTTIQKSNTAASKSKYPKRHICGGYQFSTVDLHLRRDPTVCTLYEVRQKKELLVKRASLKPYVVRQKKARPGSVVISLVFPCSTLELILTALDEEFLEIHQIVSVIIDRKPMKEYSKEYVKVCVRGEVHIAMYVRWTLAICS